jgi:hypothetical protein
VRDNFSIDSETLLMTDFINLKIKLVQSFRNAHRNMVYVHMFIEINNNICMSIYIYTVFKKTTCGQRARPAGRQGLGGSGSLYKPDPEEKQTPATFTMDEKMKNTKFRVRSRNFFSARQFMEVCVGWLPNNSS